MLRPPDLTGPAGTAWKVQVSPNPMRGTTDVARFVLHLPRVTPFWAWYVITVVHLRPMDGAPPAIVLVEGATHEVLVLAIDPNAGAPGDGWDLDDTTKAPRWLSPLECVRQVTGLVDEGAVELAASLAHAAVDGLYVPDSDRRLPQEAMIDQLAAHLRGEHARGEA